MVQSSIETKRINSFTFVRILSPIDLFSKYGERSLNGIVTCSRDGDLSIPLVTSQGSVIDSLINAQNIIDFELSSKNNNNP